MNMWKKVCRSLILVGLIFGVFGVAYATNSIKNSFNAFYAAKGIVTAGSRIDQCILCHASNTNVDIPSLETGAPGVTPSGPNPYGVLLENNGSNFGNAESADSDGDGPNNLAEITAKFFPGNPTDEPPAGDTTAPNLTAFTVPATSSSLTVSGISISATDTVGVTGYIITESATTPAPAAAGWVSVTPTTSFSTSAASYTAASAGVKTLFAWAKDAAGNVSALFTSRSVIITLGVNNGPIVDFDGDGKTDIAVYRTSTGAWYVSPSGGGASYGFGWGGDPSDKPVPGDYDGDGKTDIAVYRTSTGAWYVSPSGGGASYGFGWGGDPSDKPVPGDYDGDGKTDIAVYRTSTGAWYVSPSGGGSPFGVGWGDDASDKPVTINLSAIE
jgi:hypothetical protein